MYTIKYQYGSKHTVSFYEQYFTKTYITRPPKSYSTNPEVVFWIQRVILDIDTREVEWKTERADQIRLRKTNLKTY